MILGTIAEHVFGSTVIDGEDGMTYVTGDAWPVGALVGFDAEDRRAHRVRLLSAAPAEQARRLIPPSYLARLGEARAWRVVVMEGGCRNLNGRVWTREAAASLAAKLRGVLVAQPPNGDHLAPAEVVLRTEPREEDLLGWVSEAIAHDGTVFATIRLFATENGRAAHENLLADWARGHALPGLSVVATVDTELAIVYRSNGVGGRVSEGYEPVVMDVHAVWGLDLVAHPAAWGRFLQPTIE